MSTFNYAKDLRQSPKNRHASESYAVETVQREVDVELDRIVPIAASLDPFALAAELTYAAERVARRHDLTAAQVVEAWRGAKIIADWVIS